MQATQLSPLSLVFGGIATFCLGYYIRGHLSDLDTSKPEKKEEEAKEEKPKEGDTSASDSSSDGSEDYDPSESDSDDEDYKMVSLWFIV